MMVFGKVNRITHHPVTGNLAFETYCQLSDPGYLNVTDFMVYTEVGSLPENATLAAIRSDILFRANQETEGKHNITANDVRVF